MRARDVLVKTRGQLINHVRGAVKCLGGRLVGCTAGSFHRRVEGTIPAELKGALQPLLAMIEG